MSGPHFHVTSARNRASVRAHGLDWTRMGEVPGIAGSPVPEQEGVFLTATEFEAGFFVRMGTVEGPVDVWAVDGVDPDDLLESPEGFSYLPRVVPPGQLHLHRQDVVDPGW